MMTPATAHSLGLGTRWWAALMTTSRMPTVAEQDRLRTAVGETFEVQVDWRTASMPAGIDA
jgi:hypothetical protein